MTDPRVPARVDRAALERILQRAAELQASERDIGEGLTPAEVLDLGKDVGIPSHYLQQAMLEDETRVTAPGATGFLDRTVGVAELSAVRVVRGEPEALERSLLEWVEKNELFVVQRHQPGRITWERMGGMQAAVRRGFSTFESRRAKFMLNRADLVRAAIVSLEPGYCHVTLSASLRTTRGAYVGAAIAHTSVGVAGAIVLTVLHAWALIPVLPVLVGGGIGYYTLRRYQPVTERTRLGLERALDDLEGAAGKAAHQLPPGGTGLLELLTGEVRRAITSAASQRPKPPGKP
jgi:hypothetical protein